MAHFWVGCSGSRGDVSRLGGMSSGVRATLASYQGSIEVRLSHKDGVDYVTVTAETWKGIGDPRRLYHGPVNRREQTRVKAARKAKAAGRRK